MTSLLLVEDHEIFAESLLLVLAQRVDLTVVKVVNTAEKALQLISILDLDLLLVDMSLPPNDWHRRDRSCVTGGNLYQ